ncbi:hypothetical protein CROQUDRAFT_59804 [Cronartium quercuum f. sp. fusiforme G11]|uniref:CCHC-type domain-containing protein n=1 Tax=Cronartium quercuum f. sp. fusiforme G11 TaxID=708437 RepID=A0A9P6TE15_9BASI|nr:hypothetical protein CROQUDRAFT_59804 [Cronartium quercuum f. sp. fusiforme G11]
MVKILVVKPRPGSYRKLFAKLSTIHNKNGPFDLLICLSDLFLNDADEELEDLLDNKIPIPVRTFCMIGERELPARVQARVDSKDGQICDNLELLGPNSITTLTTLDNLRLAVFSGTFDPTCFNNSDSTSPEIDTDTSRYYIKANQLSTFLAKVKAHSQPIDILLTHSLPQLLTVHAKLLPTDPSAPAWGCAPVTEVLRQTRPRYHFAAGSQSVFWEREPWVWDSDERNRALEVTRFVNLGEFGNSKKERWFYGFNLSDAPATRPPNATISPYSLAAGPRAPKRPPMADDDDSGPNFRFAESDLNKKKARTALPPQNYVCKICEKPGHWIQDCPDNSRKTQDGYVCRICNVPGHRIQQCPMGAEQKLNHHRRTKEIGPDTCWFCLSNPQVAKHLIASIGSETYLSLPKGQLPDTKLGCPVPGGGHVLLIPIAHYPSLLGLPAELAIPVVAEVEHYKSALKRCYSAYSASIVTFELAKVTGPGARAGHAHIQVCPVPDALAPEVESAFRAEGAKLGIEFVETEDDLREKAGEGMSYFKLGLPDGKSLIHLIKPDSRFNLQFGRLTLANLLGTPDRSDWKACARTEAEEKAECEAFQKAFAAYEPKFD